MEDKNDQTNVYLSDKCNPGEGTVPARDGPYHRIEECQSGSIHEKIPSSSRLDDVTDEVRNYESSRREMAVAHVDGRVKKRKKRKTRGERSIQRNVASQVNKDSDTDVSGNPMYQKGSRRKYTRKKRDSFDSAIGTDNACEQKGLFWSSKENLKPASVSGLILGVQHDVNTKLTPPNIRASAYERSKESSLENNELMSKCHCDMFTTKTNVQMSQSQQTEDPGQQQVVAGSASTQKLGKRKKRKYLNLKKTSAKVSNLQTTSLRPISSRLELDPTARTERSSKNDSSRDSQTSLKDEKFPEPMKICKLITRFPVLYFLVLSVIHVTIFAASVGLAVTGYNIFPAVFDEFPLYIYNNARLQELSWRSRTIYNGFVYRPVYGISINTGYRGSVKDTMEVIFEKQGVNILTAQHLEWIQEAENRLFNEARYQVDFCLLDHKYVCVKPQSLLRLFDGTYSHVDSVFRDTTFSNITQVLYKASLYNETKQYLKLFLGKDSVITPKRCYTSITRSFFLMGWPLYLLSDGGFGTQADIVNYLANVFKPAVENIRDYFLVERLDVYYISKLLYEHDLVQQALTDIKLAIGSFLFIFVFMCFQTGSVVVTFLGIFSILSSFLLTNIVYRYIFQFEYFGFFHVIAIFLILGIGADDLFVFYDTWRLTGNTKYPSDAHRLSECYRRAAKTTFVTSLTTAIAFFVSGLSPLLPVKTFGIFTGILVALNYIWVIVYFPCIIIIHHTRTKLWWRKFHRFLLSMWLGVTISNVSVDTRETNSVSETNSTKSLLVDSQESKSKSGTNTPNRTGHRTHWDQTSSLSLKLDDPLSRGNNDLDPEKAIDLGKIETQRAREMFITNKYMKARKNFEDRNKVVKFLRNGFYDFMTKRIVKVLVPVLFLGISIFFIERATHLEPDTNQLRLFRNNHNYAKATERHYFYFLRNQDEEYQRVYLVWGMLPADIGGCNQKSAKFCFGTPQFDKNFDMNTPSAQLAFKDLCERLENLDPETTDTLHIQRDSNTRKPKIACFTKDFDSYFEEEIRSNWRLPSNMVLSLPVSAGNVTQLMASDSIVYRKPLPQDFNNYFEILVSYWLTDGYQLNPTKDYFSYNGLLAEKRVDGVTKPAYGTDYGLYYGTKLQFLAIEVNTTLNLYSLGYEEGLPIYQHWEDFIHSINKGMPSPLKKGIQVTENLWHWLHVQETLASSAVSGILIGLLTAWPILILTTMNVIIGTIATVTIGLVTACVVGLIPLAGWKLGVLESINLCMVVGLSVDYIVHLAEAYRLSSSTDRLGRVHDMLESIGLSVISGAITTIGAAVFMLFAKIQFFFQFGIFIISTVGISLLFSLLGFTTFLSLIGPQNNTGSLPHIFKAIVKFCKRSAAPDVEAGNERCGCPCAPPSVLVDRFYDCYYTYDKQPVSGKGTKPGRIR